MNKDSYATIHEFSIINGLTHLDEDGDPMIGWYYQFLDIYERPITKLMGPYGTNTEAEKACQKAYDRKDFS